ncbi:hypothetical protein S7711_08959 [Stachybotrys chartarum IBT 7711]|uniref:Phosphate transporter n=1 Tax=Stachybotrys chartarum (strain CBS 109288 / IBT 7711) TaxID=1280523 RepID=A0A084AYJ4_STACB|nr:hypothetical protein S7711_08959 [Stachybotrys chartarum IBT 7711]KFA77676.1 hypothetical protein S40288_02743 [Stachybotrys chartarum IBT 40288]
MPLHQFDYIFALGTIFAFLDAWNIGANDAANSWATSVSSRSINYVQAMCAGSVLEFAGAVGVGNRVSDTIRTKVVAIDQFEDNPALLMLGMMCAVIGSAIWLSICTKLALPVSTTHSIMGGVIGMGVALVGVNGVIWADFSSGEISSGVVSVFLAWIIAPGLSAGFAVVIFLITKYAVLVRSNSVIKGLMLAPIYFGITAALIVMLLIWKGGSIEVPTDDAGTAGIIVGAASAWALLVTIFLIPWLYRLVVKDDWQLRWYHIAMGPLLLRRPEPPAQPEGAAGGIRDFYEGHLTKEQLEALRATPIEDVEASAGKEMNSKTETDSETAVPAAVVPAAKKPLVGPRPEGAIYSPAVLFWGLKRAFLNGVDQDVVALQKDKTSFLTGDIEATHSHVRHFDNKTEYLYTFVQVMTACTAAFTHGANDVANAIGPYATIYDVWMNDRVEKKSPVPVWILCFGGAGIAIGIWTYGYNIMRALGNRLTLHSPSRGFSMELGAVATVILATQLSLPVSTTQCITGATVGVGLCSGTWRSINWRMVAWIYMGWIITLPCAGLISGCLAGIIINAPRWGYNYNA